MSKCKDKITFGSLIRHVEQHLVMADAELQVMQNMAWQDFSKTGPEWMAPYQLADGLARQRNLKLSEMAVTFWVAPTKIGLFSRLWSWILQLLGREDPIASAPFLKLADQGQVKESQAYEVTVVFRRDEKGGFKSDVHGRKDSGEKIFMRNFYGSVRNDA